MTGVTEARLVCPWAPDPAHPLPLSTAHQEWQGLGLRLGRWTRELGLWSLPRLCSGERQEAGHEAWMKQEASRSGPRPWRRLTSILPGHPNPHQDSTVSRVGSWLLQQGKEPGLGPASPLLAETEQTTFLLQTSVCSSQTPTGHTHLSRSL